MHQTSQIIHANRSYEGDGASVNRLFPVRHKLMNYDPFVLWDHFEITPEAGFPDHPHRGFEAITYLFKGSIQHKDNLNNHSTVHAGGAQRFTAGQGIVHSEMPQGESMSEGIQVWINLPRHKKAIQPAYQQIDAENIVEDVFDGIRVRTIVNHDKGIKLNSDVQYFDVQFETKRTYEINMPPAHRGLAYVVQGKVDVNGEKVTANNAYFFEQGISALNIKAESGSRVMVISGMPHRQPIIQHGPYVD